MSMGFEKEITNHKKGCERRGPFRNLNTECFQNHEKSQKQNGIHRAVFEEDILLDLVDITHRDLPYNQSAQSVADKDQRHGKSEGESP